MVKKIEKLNDYEGFVEKFQPKKTTDDCYTPPSIYDALLTWASENIPAIADATEIVRPFYPGGDFEHYDYPQGCAVVDNPPFSILSKITAFYRERGIVYLLFCPELTATHYTKYDDVTIIIANSKIVYDNGAEVKTAFITNAWPRDSVIVISGDLRSELARASKAARPAKKHKMIKHHPNVTSTALLGKICYGIDLELPRAECRHISKTDAGKTIFGGGLMVSDYVAAELRAAELRAAELRAAELRAAELRAAELRAAELRAAETISLSEREQTMIKELTQAHGQG